MNCEVAEQAAGAAQVVINCAAPSVSGLTPTFWVLLFSVCVASFGVWTSIRVAARRATLDFIENFETSEHYRKMRGIFSYYRRTGTMTSLRCPTELQEREARTAVTDYLNHYEIVAIGIRNRALDRQIYRTWMRGILLRDWNAAREFIQNERWKYDPAAKTWIYYDRVYDNFERLAIDFDRSIKPLTKDSFPPPDAPGDVGDEPLPNPPKT